MPDRNSNIKWQLYRRSFLKCIFFYLSSWKLILYSMRPMKCTTENAKVWLNGETAIFKLTLEYCAGIGTLPNYHNFESLIKYHKKLNRDDILQRQMLNETDDKRINKPIYREKNHFVGIEFSFESRKWLWNTNEEVDDKFWLQSKAGFIDSLQLFAMISTTQCRYNMSWCPKLNYLWHGYRF